MKTLEVDKIDVILFGSICIFLGLAVGVIIGKKKYENKK